MSSACSGGNRNHVFSMLTACALIVTSALVLPQSAFAEGSSAVTHADSSSSSRPVETIMGASNDYQAIARAAASYDASNLASAVSLAQSAAAAPAVSLTQPAQPGTVAQGEIATSPVSVAEDGTMTGTDSLGNSYSVTPVFDENSGAELVNGSVVARNDEGQSLVTSVTRGGLRNIFILDNFSSSRELSFRYDLPEGTLFQQQSDGSIIVATEVEKKIVLPAEQMRVESAVKAIVGGTNSIDYSRLTDSQIDQLAAIPEPKTITVKAQEKIATISAPWAVDAQGKPVPTHYELQGNKLTQVVDATKDTTFPVTADPAWWWWVASAVSCVVGVVGILQGWVFARVINVARHAKASSLLAINLKQYGSNFINGIISYLITGGGAPNPNDSLKKAVVTTLYNLLYLVLSAVNLLGCYNLVYEGVKAVYTRYYAPRKKRR